MNKILIGGIYRELSIKGMDTPNNSGSDHKQIRRWRVFIFQWRDAAQHPACIIIGDTNLDELKWMDPEHAPIPMVDMVKEEIITMNFNQLKCGSTATARLLRGKTSTGVLVIKMWWVLLSDTRDQNKSDLEHIKNMDPNIYSLDAI